MQKINLEKSEMRNNDQTLSQQMFLETFYNTTLDKNPGKLCTMTKRIPEKHQTQGQLQNQ